jgi:hypothetical protein
MPSYEASTVCDREERKVAGKCLSARALVHVQLSSWGARTRSHHCFKVVASDTPRAGGSVVESVVLSPDHRDHGLDERRGDETAGRESCLVARRPISDHSTADKGRRPRQPPPTLTYLGATHSLVNSLASRTCCEACFFVIVPASTRCNPNRSNAVAHISATAALANPRPLWASATEYPSVQGKKPPRRIDVKEILPTIRLSLRITCGRVTPSRWRLSALRISERCPLAVP